MFAKTRDGIRIGYTMFGNANAEKKVALIPGAVDLLVAGGYVNNPENKEDAFLVHDAQEKGLGALRYTAAR